MGAYSFGDVSASITGPTGTITIVGEVGNADEGITVTRNDNQNTMTTGADTGVMHSLSKVKSGTVTVRLLKTSPLNAVLMNWFNVQTSSAALHGQNVIVVRDVARGDVASARQAAFRKMPDNAWSKVGNIIEWAFDCGQVDELLGTGTPSIL